jgi:hypothetical protein
MKLAQRSGPRPAASTDKELENPTFEGQGIGMRVKAGVRKPYPPGGEFSTMHHLAILIEKGP